MAVKLKNGAVFLHVPKTGGSWVTEVLTECGLVARSVGHIHADFVRAQYYSSGARAMLRIVYERLKSRVPRSLKARIMSPHVRRRRARRATASKPFVFCFVRHPTSWYESWWRYMCGRSGADWTQETDLLGWHPCQSLKGLGDPNFDRFVQNVIQGRPGFVTELFGQYTQPGIDFIGKQEQLADDLIAVLKRLELEFDEGRIRQRQPVNVSQHDNPIAKWDDALRAEVERLEYAGLVRYNYPSSVAFPPTPDGVAT